MVNKQTSESQRLREILGKKQNNVLSITEILRCIGLSLKVLFTIRCRNRYCFKYQTFGTGRKQF